MVLAPEHPLVDALTAAAWPDGTDPRWTGGAATPAEAVAAYQRQASRRSELDRQDEGREKTGVWLGVTAVNPVNGRELPVFIADYVLTGYGTGAIMAVPGEDTRDLEFAEAFGLPVVRTVQPPADFDGGAYTGAGPMINSANDEISLDGLDKADGDRARSPTGWSRTAHGEATTTYKLRDWLFSRQRYWGEPFPIVYDENDLPVAVPDSMLPVLLPEVDDYSPKTFADDDADSAPEPPLSRATEWTTVELDLGDGPKKYRRETNTMPNWAGSCWYYLRYLDPGDDERRWSTRSWSGTGWARGRRATSAASTCTSAASSTPCCTCCTPASGTRCCSTWATSPARSRSAGWSTRATSRPTPTPTSAASTCPRPRSWRRTAGSSTRASRSTASTGRSARA